MNADLTIDDLAKAKRKIDELKTIYYVTVDDYWESNDILSLPAFGNYPAYIVFKKSRLDDIQTLATEADVILKPISDAPDMEIKPYPHKFEWRDSRTRYRFRR